MLKDEVKAFVYMEFLNNETGFTMINLMLRILIISVSLPVFVFVLGKIQVIPSNESLQIQQLYFLLQNDVYIATEVSHDTNRLYFHLETGETVQIEKYQDTLRRRVNQKGHEIYARNIHSFSLHSLPYGIIVSIETTKGGIYERTLITNKK